MVTGRTPDISEFLDFKFWDTVWYHVGSHPSTTTSPRALARWLGVSHRIGADMCYWILPVSRVPIAETTVQHVTLDEMNTAGVKQQVDEFNDKLTRKLKENNSHGIQALGEQSYLQDIYDFEHDDPKAYGNGSNTPTDGEYRNS